MLSVNDGPVSVLKDLLVMAEEEKAAPEPTRSEVSRMEPAPSEVSRMNHNPNKPVMGGLTQTNIDKSIAESRLVWFRGQKPCGDSSADCAWSIFNPLKRKSKIAGPSSIQDKTWRNWPCTSMLEHWNSKMQASMSTT